MFSNKIYSLNGKSDFELEAVFKVGLSSNAEPAALLYVGDYAMAKCCKLSCYRQGWVTVSEYYDEWAGFSGLFGGNDVNTTFSKNVSDKLEADYNKIKIEHKSEQGAFLFFINDSFIHKHIYKKFPGSRIGLGSSKKTELLVRSITIKV